MYKLNSYREASFESILKSQFLKTDIAKNFKADINGLNLNAVSGSGIQYLFDPWIQDTGSEMSFFRIPDPQPRF